jgi:hypothetical protein
MVIVLAIIGILATVGYPFLRDAENRARAADVASRVHNAALAYAAAGAPDSVGSSGPGVVPPLLAESLSPGAFTTPYGIVLWVHSNKTGRVLIPWVFVRASTPQSRAILTAYHRMTPAPHLLLGTMVLYPLNSNAEAQARTGRPQ